MQYLTALYHLPREVWIAAAVGAGIATLVLLLLLRGGRRRYVLVGNSPVTELFAFQLGRVADALERVSIAGIPAAPELPAPNVSRQAPTPPPPPAEERPTQHVSMSMFGR